LTFIISFPNRTPPNKKNTWYHLEVDGDSLMRVPPVNQTVIEHHPATFDCVVKEPATMTVTWFKDGKSLSTFTDLFARTIQHANGSLTIRETLMNDLGIFECRVKKIFGGEENARAYLNVQCLTF
jgi:immunoglobulin superfamily member 9B